MGDAQIQGVVNISQDARICSDEDYAAVQGFRTKFKFATFYRTKDEKVMFIVEILMEILKDLENGQRKHSMGKFRKNISQSQILWNSISHRNKKVIKTRITKTEHEKGDYKYGKERF